MSRHQELFDQGRKLYQQFKPRPPVPTDEECDDPEACLWYGWMIERAMEINKIYKERDRIIEQVEHMPAFSRKHVERNADRRILMLDIRHGLSPFRRDKYGHSLSQEQVLITCGVHSVK